MCRSQLIQITTFDVVHDSVDPQGLIKDVQRALRPDGTYLILEINASGSLENNLNPMGKLFYSISTMYCMTVSLAHGGAGLGTCMGEEKPRQMCANAGFSHFSKTRLPAPAGGALPGADLAERNEVLIGGSGEPGPPTA